MKKGSIALIILLLAASIFAWYIKANPPLYITGWGPTYYPDKKELQGINVDIKNKGFTGLRLEKVYINENENPEVAELGISRTDSMVQKFTPDVIKKRGISFHKLDEFKVKVDLSPKKKQDLSKDKDLIKHYGIWVHTSGKPVYEITIKYKYLGIPFTLKRNLKK